MIKTILVINVIQTKASIISLFNFYLLLDLINSVGSKTLRGYHHTCRFLNGNEISISHLKMMSCHIVANILEKSNKHKHAGDLRSNKPGYGHCTQSLSFVISMDIRAPISLLRAETHQYLQQVSNVFNFTALVNLQSSLLASLCTQCTSYDGILIWAIRLKAVSYKRPLTEHLSRVVFSITPISLSSSFLF